MNLAKSNIPITVKTARYDLYATLSLDGNQWCVLAGIDLQVGIAGFGATPELAIADFKKAMANG